MIFFPLNTKTLQREEECDLSAEPREVCFGNPTDPMVKQIPLNVTQKGHTDEDVSFSPRPCMNINNNEFPDQHSLQS